jgi:hypothetical protein
MVTTAFAWPRRPATAIIGTSWADQPGGVGVTEIVEVQPAILGPQMR